MPFLAVLLWALPASEVAPDFFRDIQPIFQKRCAECHTAKARGGLRLDQPKNLFGGSESGPVVVAGKPADSLLIRKVTSKDPGERMPPQGESLSPGEVDLLRAWVAAGAKIPAMEEKENWWAFQPLAKPSIPAGQQPIDFLIRQRLKAKGWDLSAPADKTALLRRVTYDITGLPPSVDEIRRFLKTTLPKPTSAWSISCSPVPRTANDGPGYGLTWSTTPTPTGTTRTNSARTRGPTVTT